MADIIKTFYGKLLDWSGLANIPAALKALAGLKGSTGQIIEISGTGGDGTVTALTAVDKPAGNGAVIPTKVSAFENDAGYTTEARVQELLAEFPTFKIEVVQELPAVGVEKTIYLLPFADDSGSYLEYLYVNGAWEVVGNGKNSGENADAIRDAVFEYMEQDATGAVVAVDVQEPTAEDNTTYIVMQSRNGTIFRLAIGNNGLPFVTNEAGDTVWSGASGGTGGDSSGGEDSGGGDSSTEIPSDVQGVYTNSVITEIPDDAFNRNANLTGINAPNVTKVGKNAFIACTSLVDVSLPKAETIGDFAFTSTTALTKVALPKCKSLGVQAFMMSAITTLDLGGVPTGGISYQALGSTSALSALILRCDSTVWSVHSVSFPNSAIANGDGYIYVPSKLLNSYKTATNWASYAEQFRALEDYTVDGTINGELDETKIGGNAA